MQDDAGDPLGRPVPGMGVQVSILSLSMELHVAAEVVMAVSGGASKGTPRWPQGHIKRNETAGKIKNQAPNAIHIIKNEDEQ